MLFALTALTAVGFSCAAIYKAFCEGIINPIVKPTDPSATIITMKINLIRIENYLANDLLPLKII